MDGFRDYTIHDVKETCMAECICHFERLDISDFHCIYTKNDNDMQIIESLKAKYNIAIRVTTYPSFFV